MLDLISDGRVEFGTGRSSTRAELEGFGIDPHETREMWQEAIGHIVGCWTNDEYEFEGKHWSMPKRRVLPKPMQKPHPPIWGATSQRERHALVGELGLGLLSFAVGDPPEELKRTHRHLPRRASPSARKPVGKFVNDQAARFTMVNCAPTRTRRPTRRRRGVVRVVPEDRRARIIGVARGVDGRGQAGARQLRLLGEHARPRQGAGIARRASTMDYLLDIGACVVGDPDEVHRDLRRYEAAGCDLLLCLVNPYNIPHEKVMQTIELIGKHVIPEFAEG